jgi:hypothetical protein
MSGQIQAGRTEVAGVRRSGNLDLRLCAKQMQEISVKT